MSLLPSDSNSSSESRRPVESVAPGAGPALSLMPSDSNTCLGGPISTACQARRSRGTERRGTSQADGARSARRLVSMCRARGRDASRPAGCRDPRGSHRASSGGSVRTRRSTGGGADARGGKTRALDSEERASRSTRTELGTSPRAAAARLKHSPMTPPGCARPSDVPRQGRYLGPRQQNAFSGSRKSRLASVMSVALPIKAATLKLGRRARARHPARGESAAGIPSRT